MAENAKNRIYNLASVTVIKLSISSHLEKVEEEGGVRKTLNLITVTQFT